MEKSSLYFDSILKKLAQSYPGSCALEELRALVMPPYNVQRTFAQNMSAQRQNQAEILDALILLDEKGYIVLNEATDESSITLKGLVKINHTVLCN
ncbi:MULTISPECIES: hypothetical protein [Flavobacterium]|uniref:hypothetical protein n=1 Tax=Flavobacterium TaxID=237 RepID=UPI0021146ADF|nr:MULTISPECIES: hypothetical protein [Flavobacterium]UUF12525.1 hypothetical protein NLJ00_14815 [Flavobacterium panici]